MLRAFCLMIVITFGALAAGPAAAAQYQSKELGDAADAYRQGLADSLAANKRRPALIPRLRKDADAEFRARRYAQAIDDLTTAIAYGANDAATWLALAEVQFAAKDDHARASAYNAYLRATGPGDRGAALFVIGSDLDRHEQFKDALVLYRAGLALTKSPDIATRVAQLARIVAFHVVKTELEAEAEFARLCLKLNDQIATGSAVSYPAYVRSEPALDGVVTGRGDAVCLDGLKHGETYAVQLLAGFPSLGGEKTEETFNTRVVVPDRQPAISFAGTGYVLPREGSAGLPVTTLNLDTVKVRILRVNERNLVPSIDADKLTMTFDPDDVDTVINHTGSLVWQGEMAIAGARNRPVVTAIPLKDILKDKGPGVYLAVVQRADKKGDYDALQATNWILVSDLGLTAYTGSDGLTIAVRSLNDAKPVSGVSLRLYARNNSELTAIVSDPDGLARISAGLLHGRGGDSPFAVMAYGPNGDFNFLEVGRGAFDLSDRGVEGRLPPGPVDAFLYTERGIYRPGETVHLSVLVRDDKADAATGLPLELRLIRPDGVEVEHRQLSGDKLGAYAADFALARDARIGGWRVELRLDPKAPAIGSAEFRVEDFVPPTLKLALTAPDEPLVPGRAFAVTAAAEFYYGAPGAGLAVDGNLQIGLDDNPYPDWTGYSFGLAGEEYAGDRKDLEPQTTGDDGKAELAVDLGDVPDKTRPLAATIEVEAYEPSGRAISATLTRPIRQRPLAIGLNSPDGEGIAEGQAATLDVIALDRAGKRVAAPGLRWELLEETWHYEWYSVNGSWRHRSEIRDRPVAAGSLDVGADKPATLAKTLQDGRYRWEVADGASGAQSSLRFEVGWEDQGELPDSPDKLQATLDQKQYRPGDTAKLFIKAPYAGEAEVAIAGDKIISLRSVSLPADGTTIEIPVGSDWGSGVYALVSAYRPAQLSASVPGPKQRGPGRAVGVAWLGIDPAARSLAVAFAAPDVVRPRAAVEIPLKVSGLAPGEEAYVTLAAVDEAVLKLTDYATPAPDKYYFGKRQLGVELRDLYGRLIDPRAGAVGTLRSGGDQFAKRSVAGLPDKSSRVVALYSGIVRLDPDGAAKIHFDMPDFQGQVRLMAVAFAAHKIGSASGQMIVRDKVVTLVSLPRFLAPGDSARIGVTINNVEGAAGDYRLTLSAKGAGSFAAPIVQTIPLATGQNFADGFALNATGLGNVALTLDLTGPGDTHIARDFTIGVRAAQPYQLRRFVGQLAPGQSVTLDDSAADDFLPGTGEALLSVSPRPEWDVPGLLRSLDHYAYGCIEQTTSRALPLLYVEEVAKLWNTDPGFSPAASLAGAIEHIAAMQKPDGSFGIWDDSGPTVPWLDAYATDFLLRAKDHGQAVPGYVTKSAVAWLHDYVGREHKDDKDLPALAYAHYVLAEAKADDLPVLRYFADTQMENLPTQLAKAQLAAALASYGDVQRAAAAYAAALAPPGARKPEWRYIDYGSDLRDNAAVLAFAAADQANAPRLTAVIDRIAGLFAKARRTSTQEQAWLLMAAEAAAKLSGGKMTVAADAGAAQTRSEPVYLRRELGAGGANQTVTNKGTAPVWRSVSITGVPSAELPAESDGYLVSRSVVRADDTPADLSQVRQTDRYVVILHGSRSDWGHAARALVVDLLPAGFEIETASAASSDSNPYPWLKNLSTPVYSEPRDDRYIAALDLDAGVQEFTLAYVVRAVTPGTFKYPALEVEDMYDPETAGRTAIGRLTVLPR